MISCQKGPTRHDNAWQIEPFWQDTLDMNLFWYTMGPVYFIGLMWNINFWNPHVMNARLLTRWGRYKMAAIL